MKKLETNPKKVAKMLQKIARLLQNNNLNDHEVLKKISKIVT